MQMKGTLKGAWFGSTNYINPVFLQVGLMGHFIWNHWFGCSPLGHNVFRNTIRRLFEHAEIPGFYTNHSLRTTAGTTCRLFDAGVDEQLIMKRTGHQSVAGVRSYKRVTDKLNMFTSCVLNEQVLLAKKLKEEHEVVESEKAMPVLPVRTRSPLVRRTHSPFLTLLDPRISLWTFMCIPNCFFTLPCFFFAVVVCCCFFFFFFRLFILFYVYSLI